MIFDIKEFAVHDGPGIRTTVFFKGCPLNCIWCHNPEGLSFKKELMISRNTCIHCGKCQEICINNVCIACGKCVDVCPLRIRKLVGEIVEAKVLAKQLLEHKDFFKEKNGGITISGGEPLSQPTFLFDLLKELEGINKAIDTSGYSSTDIFKEAIKLSDLVLFDIKHLNNTIHKKVTGVNNDKILKNLSIICNSNIKFFIRIPLIPGINDNKNHMEEIAKLVRDAEIFLEYIYYLIIRLLELNIII